MAAPEDLSVINDKKDPWRNRSLVNKREKLGPDLVAKYEALFCHLASAGQHHECDEFVLSAESDEFTPISWVIDKCSREDLSRRMAEIAEMRWSTLEELRAKITILDSYAYWFGDCAQAPANTGVMLMLIKSVCHDLASSLRRFGY